MEVVILNGSEINAGSWDGFVLASPQGMIYSCHYYISTLEPGWQAIIVKSGDTWHAAMPFVLRKKAGLSYSTQPLLVQYWGIMFRPAEANIAKSFEQKRQWVKLILKTFPGVRFFDYNFSPAFDYPLPFFWTGHTVKPRYTNQIVLEGTKDELWSNISEKARGHIRKTEKDSISLSIGTDFDTVINIFRKAKGEDVKGLTDFHYKALADIAQHYSSKGMCYTIVAHDNAGSAVAGCLYFAFRDTAIHFMGSTDPAFKGRGAMAAIIWQAIQKAKTDGCRIFDFEGSMIEPVEQFFLSFGSTPTLYLHILKEQLPVWARIARAIKNR